MQLVLSKNLPRSGRIAAIGGGSVGDVTGFAASVYKRGVKLTHGFLRRWLRRKKERNGKKTKRKNGKKADILGDGTE